jgi:hypothetical protein
MQNEGQGRMLGEFSPQKNKKTAVRNCRIVLAFSGAPRRTMMDQPKTSPAGDGEHSATNDSGADLARALRTMEQKIAEEQRR